MYIFNINIGIKYYLRKERNCLENFLMIIILLSLLSLIVFSVLFLVKLIFRKGLPKKKIGIILVSSFAALLVSFIIFPASNVEDATQVSDISNDEGENEDKEDGIFTIGDIVELGDTQLILTNVSFIEPTDFTEPEKEKVLLVEFEAANKGDEKLYFGSEEFKISTLDGVQHSRYYAHGDGFINESIIPGKKIKDKLYYDVPEEEVYELTFTPTFRNDDESIVFEVEPQ